ncbi:hypothetical protein KY285_029772 [Solanum tuberosum]|nr:hypothetical protein KY289_029940 [Solanum tuberosum]KAH0654890.1 hypothetical protein KY285_029772 [Solanum tuberosum]
MSWKECIISKRVKTSVTYACPSTRKEIKYEFYLVTMSFIYYVWINGSKRYMVYVHFAEEMYEMVSLTVQFLTQQHFLFEYPMTSEGILKAPLNGVYFPKHLELGRVISPIGAC